MDVRAFLRVCVRAGNAGSLHSSDGSGEGVRDLDAVLGD